ncbi:MAG TPA: molybdopterin-synthase adenylyltransferase MoeB [Chthoniobacterales bacterium]|jgi:adenylyltransferase/sulfurtransferase|nr:molybdopterin-synthase adenylyltransferase MoeB [Chthoniobacterales bacterium]
MTKDEQLRYSRHMIMPEVGPEGQRRLNEARVLCIGAGGLGSPAALYLAAAGIGTLGLVDFDDVDLSNLQRQILHGTKDVGRKKLDSARDRLRDVNPTIEIETHQTRLTSANAMEIISKYDIVVDGSDNFQTRYLSNDVCVFAKKPNVYGSVFRFDGQTTVFAPHLGGPCYRCLFPEPPEPGSVPNCAQAGVLGVLPGIVGTIQANEAIKLILGIGEPLIGRLLYFDALKMKFREFNLRRDPQCPVCGEAPTITEPIDYEQFCGVGTTAAVPTVSVAELKQKLETHENFQLVDVREPFEHEMESIDGAKLIPLGELPERLNELERQPLTIVHCHSGQRSAQAVRLMREAGFANVFNLEGGIAKWLDEEA